MPPKKAAVPYRNDATTKAQIKRYYKSRSKNRYGEREVNSGSYPGPPASPSKRSRERTKSNRRRWNRFFKDPQNNSRGPAFCFFNRNSRRMLCVPSNSNTYRNKSVRSCTRQYNGNGCRKQKTSIPRSNRYYDKKVYTKMGRWARRSRMAKRSRNEANEPRDFLPGGRARV